MRQKVTLSPIDQVPAYDLAGFLMLVHVYDGWDSCMACVPPKGVDSVSVVANEIID